jgi:hypothetical protein
LEVTVDGGPPKVVSLDSPETAFGVKVPVVTGLRQGQHEVHITAQPGAVIDGFVVQDRPTWLIRRVIVAGGAIVALMALGWLTLWRQREKHD